MSSEQITSEAMALPLAERVSLAQALWESINADLPGADEAASLDEAIRRDEELSSGQGAGRCHEDVIKSARRAI